MRPRYLPAAAFATAGFALSAAAVYVRDGNLFLPAITSGVIAYACWLYANDYYEKTEPAVEPQVEEVLTEAQPEPGDSKCAYCGGEGAEEVVYVLSKKVLLACPDCLHRKQQGREVCRWDNRPGEYFDSAELLEKFKHEDVKYKWNDGE